MKRYLGLTLPVLIIISILMQVASTRGLPSGRKAIKFRIDDDKDQTAQLRVLLDHLKIPYFAFVETIAKKNEIKKIRENYSYIVKQLTEEAIEQIDLIHSVTLVDKSLILAYNLTYETMCTTSVIRGPEGQFMMGRNLDFNYRELLSPLVIEVGHFYQGKLKYVGAGFFGFITYVNFSVKGEYMISLNERYNRIGGFDDKLSNLIEGRISPFFLMLQVLKTAHNYYEAVSIIQSADLSSPGYFIICSDKLSQALTIGRSTYDRKSKEFVKQMLPSEYMLVQANSDPVDCNLNLETDRRRGCVATYRIREKGNKISEENLLEIQSSQNVRTKLTIYTSIMADHLDLFYTYVYDPEIINN